MKSIFEIFITIIITITSYLFNMNKFYIFYIYINFAKLKSRKNIKINLSRNFDIYG